MRGMKKTQCLDAWCSLMESFSAADTHSVLEHRIIDNPILLEMARGYSIVLCDAPHDYPDHSESLRTVGSTAKAQGRCLLLIRRKSNVIPRVHYLYYERANCSQRRSNDIVMYHIISRARVGGPANPWVEMLQVMTLWATQPRMWRRMALHSRMLVQENGRNG